MIEGIKGESVEAWWPLVEEYLNSALKHGLGEYSIADIKSACKSKDMQLWVKVGKKAKGAFVTKIAKYPQKNLQECLQECLQERVQEYPQEHRGQCPQEYALE